MTSEEACHHQLDNAHIPRVYGGVVLSLLERTTIAASHINLYYAADPTPKKVSK